MKISSLLLFSATGALLAGCATPGRIDPLQVNTARNSPVRIHMYQTEKQATAGLSRILMLPPMGIDDPDLQAGIYERFYSSAQRRFTTPLRRIPDGSAYAPYIDEENLIREDGSVDTGEASFVGALMNCTHVICPIVRRIRPYHPQSIDLKILFINAGTGHISAEFSSVLDAADRDVMDYFEAYSKARKDGDQTMEDLMLKVKSPTAYQDFAADVCATVMADRLNL